MSAPHWSAAESSEPDPRPWTIEGARDPDVGDRARAHIHAALTDPRLTERFRRRYPLWRRAEYDDMVRALGYVWDCRVDQTANVTGYHCARCGRPRAQVGA